MAYSTICIIQCVSLIQKSANHINEPKNMGLATAFAMIGRSDTELLPTKILITASANLHVFKLYACISNSKLCESYLLNTKTWCRHIYYFGRDGRTRACDAITYRCQPDSVCTPKIMWTTQTNTNNTNWTVPTQNLFRHRKIHFFSSLALYYPKCPIVILIVTQRIPSSHLNIALCDQISMEEFGMR